jgi:hypothetical protein
VRIQPSALEALAAEKERVLERSFPLLESALRAQGGETATTIPQAGNGERSPAPRPAPTGLDALLGEVPGDGAGPDAADEA